MAKSLPDDDRENLWAWVKTTLEQRDDKDALVVGLGLNGLRGIEVRQLVTTAIDRQHLQVRTAKNGVPRTLLLARPMAVAIMSFASHQNQVHGHRQKVVPMFPTSQGQTMDSKQIRRIIKRATLEACTKAYNFHQLRHTFAWQIYRDTRDPLLVQKLLGHSNLANTQIYLDSLETEAYSLPGWEETTTKKPTETTLKIWRPTTEVKDGSREMGSSDSRKVCRVVYRRRAPVARKKIPRIATGNTDKKGNHTRHLQQGTLPGMPTNCRSRGYYD